MVDARGSSLLTHVAMAYETTPKTAASGNYQRLAYTECGLGSQEDLVPPERLGEGRDPGDSDADVLTIGGPLSVPLDVRNIGYHLKALMGAPDTDGSSAPYTHRFQSGGEAAPHVTFELGYGQVSEYNLYPGVRYNDMQFGLTKRGRAVVRFGLVGFDEQNNATTQAGTLRAPLTLQEFLNKRGSIHRNAVELANMVSSDLTFSNNMEESNVLRSDGLIGSQDLGPTSCAGELTARFADDTLLDDAINGTYLGLDWPFVIDASNKITFSVLRALLGRRGIPINGPGVIQQGLNFTGSGHVLTAPTTPAAAVASGGSLPDGTAQYYVITALDAQGRETDQSSEVTATPSGANLTVDLSWDAEPGAASYKVYRSLSTGVYGATSYLATAQVPSYSDTGGTALSTGAPPTASENPMTMMEIILVNDVANYNDPNGN